ncbi:spore maturation protein [Pasteuria penetrans]|uniref:spore maturation protein n=1 Tax=Pasteuria penetrans TaxID=86005 RepID=UPI000FAD0756|nr:nucleoside recognition domain-containing protein [Pasteuria penetrans]
MSLHEVLSYVNKLFIPLLLLVIPTVAYFRRVSLVTTFVEGAKGSIPVVLSLFPYLVAMWVAIFVFRESGAFSLLTRFFAPLLELFHIPRDIFPLGLLRSLSGSGGNAFVGSIFREHGPDSFIGNLASVMQVSTETTLYVVATYFGAIGVRRIRYALAVGLLSDVVGLVAAVAICHWWFR